MGKAEAREDASAGHESSQSLFHEACDVMPWDWWRTFANPDRLLRTCLM